MKLNIFRYPVIVNTYLHIVGGIEHLIHKHASQHPQFAAEKTLRLILSLAKHSTYGKEHHFAEILKTPSTKGLFRLYQHMVPANDYENLRPYIERMKNGERDVLFGGKPYMYATTSGTTSEPKWIPLNPRYLKKVYGNMSHLWVFNHIRKRPMCLAGHILQITGKACEGQAPDGTLFGSVSGVLVRDLPSIIKRRYTIPDAVLEIEDYHVRNYTIMTLSLQHEDLTYWATANPSTVLELLRTVDEHYDQMVEDIRTGTLSAEIAPELKQQIAPYLHANPRRANQLAALKATNPTPDPKDYWPYLQLLTTWKCGNTRVYMEKYLHRFDLDQTYYPELGFIATECRIGFPMDDNNDSALFPNYHYYEFVEESQLGKPNPPFLQIDQLEQGKRYCIYVTTCTGLYRYNMNDLVEVSGMYEKTPTLHLVSKANGIVSMTGEKLYETQYIQAIHEAETETRIRLRFFVAFANVEESEYELYLEFEKPDIQQETADAFAVVVDKNLQRINIEYEAKRRSFRLNPPVAHILYDNAYSRFKVCCLNNGMRDGQFKFNLLMQDEKRQQIFQELVLVHQDAIADQIVRNRTPKNEKQEQRQKKREERRKKRMERRMRP